MKPAFRDRPAAGRRLAGLLKEHKGSEALVLAIPAGGVPVAAAIANALGLQLRVAPVSKVLLPWTTESGFGAVAFDGSVWIDPAAVENFGLNKDSIEKALADARAKVERRSARLGTRLTDLDGKTIILVDDGIVAVPTAHERSLEALRSLADDIVCADIRGGASFAVADAYEEWRDLSDDEIERMLKP